MNLHGPSAEGVSREAAVRQGMIMGFIDTLITLGAMVVTNSAVILADFCKTFLEFVAVFLSWCAIRRMARGSGGCFDYGLGKMENLTSLVVGTLMTLCLLIITGNAVRNILHPVHIAGIGVKISMVAQVAYAFINSRVALRNRRAAQEGNSPLLEAQARLHFTRAVANVFILFSLVMSIALARYGWSRFIDPAASLVIAGSILMAALGIFSTSVGDLLDRTLEESDQLLILRELTKHFDDYEFLHGIRSRRAGTEVFVEILLEFDPEKKAGEIQAVADDLRREIEGKIRNSHVTIGLSTGPVSAPVER
ncbi:MAG: cation diffusion facilitator family transporter [Phycisphaerae bacterium]|nr:cation diffusion facilitator family transporter [Phycisphaerae bacterium]